MTHTYRCKKCSEKVWCSGFNIYACVLKMCQECLDEKAKSAGSIEKVLEDEDIKRSHHEWRGMQFQMLWSKEDLEELGIGDLDG